MKKDQIYWLPIIIAVVWIILAFANKYMIFLFPLIIVVLTLLKIEYGFAFIIATLGMDFTGFYNNFIGPLHPNSISVIGMLLFLGISIVKLKKVSFSQPSRIFLVFMIYILISLLLSPAKFEGLKMYGKFLVMFLLLVLFSNFNLDFFKVMKYLLVGGAVSIFVFNTIFYFVLGNPIVAEYTGRLRLFGGNFWATAYPLFMGVCFIASLLLYKKYGKYRYLAFAGLYFAYAIASYTRAVWIALFVVVTLYFVYNKSWFKLTAMFILIFFVFLNVLVYLFVLEGANLDTKKTFTQKFTAGRSDLWEVFYKEFKEQPVLGLGFEYSMKESERLAGIKSMHSDPLRVLFDLGIIGFVFYFWYMFVQGKHLFKIRDLHPYRYVMLFFVFYVLTSLVGNIFNYIQCIGFPVFTLLGLASRRVT